MRSRRTSEREGRRGAAPPSLATYEAALPAEADVEGVQPLPVAVVLRTTFANGRQHAAGSVNERRGRVRAVRERDESAVRMRVGAGVRLQRREVAGRVDDADGAGRR